MLAPHPAAAPPHQPVLGGPPCCVIASNLPTCIHIHCSVDMHTHLLTNIGVCCQHHPSTGTGPAHQAAVYCAGGARALNSCELVSASAARLKNLPAPWLGEQQHQQHAERACVRAVTHTVSPGGLQLLQSQLPNPVCTARTSSGQQLAGVLLYCGGTWDAGNSCAPYVCSLGSACYATGCYQGSRSPVAVVPCGGESDAAPVRALPCLCRVVRLQRQCPVDTAAEAVLHGHVFRDECCFVVVLLLVTPSCCFVHAQRFALACWSGSPFSAANLSSALQWWGGRTACLSFAFHRSHCPAQQLVCASAVPLRACANGRLVWGVVCFW